MLCKMAATIGVLKTLARWPLQSSINKQSCTQVSCLQSQSLKEEGMARPRYRSQTTTSKSSAKPAMLASVTSREKVILIFSVKAAWMAWNSASSRARDSILLAIRLFSLGHLAMNWVALMYGTAWNPSLRANSAADSPSYRCSLSSVRGVYGGLSCSGSSPSGSVSPVPKGNMPIKLLMADSTQRSDESVKTSTSFGQRVWLMRPSLLMQSALRQPPNRNCCLMPTEVRTPWNWAVSLPSQKLLRGQRAPWRMRLATQASLEAAVTIRKKTRGNMQLRYELYR